VTVTLTAVAALAAVIVAGLFVLFLVDGESPPPESSPEAAEPAIDVAGFPRGALAGQPAPEFSLSLFDGTEFVLSAHLSGDGRPVVLNLWASWCTPCRREIPEFSEVAVANPEVAFVGAAVEDARGPAEAFAAQVEAAYPLGIDHVLTVKNGYPFVGLPVTYLINADGTVSRQIQGQLSGAALQAFIDYDFGG
jgi:cytochrome c biogenesis protein CcmG/thiol:disulfide interchange protein DsbE